MVPNTIFFDSEVKAQEEFIRKSFDYRVELVKDFCAQLNRVEGAGGHPPYTAFSLLPSPLADILVIKKMFKNVKTEYNPGGFQPHDMLKEEAFLHVVLVDVSLDSDYSYSGDEDARAKAATFWKRGIFYTKANTLQKIGQYLSRIG